MTALTIEELYRVAGIVPSGSASWGKVDDERPRVYVISIADPETVSRASLPEKERGFWNPHQRIIYIGRATNLSRRLRQFSRHKYGERAPHHGGQAILAVDRPKQIDYAACDDALSAADAEHRLIEAFKAATGRLPFGNRVRSARMRAL
jgi:hypothetical protein